MGSQALSRLPTIDFSNVNKQNRDSVWDSTKTQVFEALQEFGCFEASFNGISHDLRNSVFSSLKELFDLPLETKVRNFTEKLYNGYIGLAKQVPIFESMGIEDPQSFANLMWPNGNDEFSKCIKIYSDKLTELDEIVRTMVLESLNLEKYMDEHMELTSYITRVMKYRVPQKDEPNAGLLSHADKNIVTILHEFGVEGLEVQTKDGEWFKVKLSANSFVVMVGEAFKVLTNGRLRPAVHRVVMSGDEDRFSIGVFSVPKDEKTIKAPEEMVDEDHPLLFKPFVYEEFFKFFRLEENVNDPLALEKYCGVSTENL
ncbi:2-oxoglutarate (2OG) and Fe(II)-dependent oxygenase superfamily protein [Artemisia annua]|uniref:2-oxoglutarate-dependent dioxygenase DAO n=1 Tax=Artemisia annua TaxID=35608 RepID=A0A2U1N6V3_ARTAN|nr:2-oxoglutarate (2OG) and Fe(II)-dependent oxygenase superfamily protein [Artemisia annua]